MMHCDFDTGSLKALMSNFSFGREGGHRKEYSVYAFDNVDNSERLLNTGPFKSYRIRPNKRTCSFFFFFFLEILSL